jgi:hypothetical protein
MMRMRAGAARAQTAKDPIPSPRARAAKPPRVGRALALVLAGALAATVLAACGTSQPKPVADVELAAAQTFPYFPVYWVGRVFEGRPLAAVDGLDGYISNVGDGVYYGNCVQKKTIFESGSCQLLLQITTVIYQRHSNQPLGPQRNILIRGVPAVVYDEGRSVEVYSGHVAIDIFSNSLRHALDAAEALRPVNAPGSPSEDLPPPAYCPGLYGPQEVALARVTEGLRGHVCQEAAKQHEYLESVKAGGKG